MKWQAVIEGMAAGETTEDYIEFEDPQSLETKVKFKKAPPSVISLRPVCPENLTVSFNLSDAAEIYPCDSTIQLSFNKPIAAACKDKVLVRIPDIPEARTALSYFKPSQLQNKDLTLFADVSEDDYSNLIPVTASGKIISVILNASDFYYENTDYGETIPIYLKNDITFSYSINSNTTKKSTIKYVVPANIASVGLLRVDEDDARTQSYRVGKEINLKYILQNDDYAFKGWSFAYASTDAENAVFEPVAIQDIKKNLNIDIKYENNEDTLGYDALTKTAQATITVYNYKEGIISVSPVVGSISKTQIATTDPSETGVGEFKVNGVTASDNVIEYRPGQTLVLKYKLTKYDDYRFLGWSAKRTYIDTDGTHTQTYTIDDFTAENLANFNLSFEYDEDSESNGYDSLSRTAKVTVTIDDYIDGQITISPVVWSISKTQIITTDPSETGVGEFKVNGVTASDNIIEYRPGQTLVLKYKLTKYEDYRFLGWSAKRTYVNTEGTQTQTYNLEQFTPQNLSNFKLSVSYEDNADTWGYDSLTRNAVLTLTVADYIDGEITISPIVQKIPTADIYIDGANGKLNPAKGNHSTKQNQINTISFEPDGDYEFLHWQVYDTNTNQPLNYTDYLEITDVNKSETTCKLLAVPSETLNIKIGLRAVVTERPQVISATPSYTAEGANRDSRIQVVFDKDIDENSIYYSDPEITDLIDQLELENEDFLPEIDPTKPDEKHYGYVIRDENDEIVDIIYKNIKIQNNRDISINLLEHYEKPYFENSKTLIIPAKLNNYPSGGTTLLVTLDKSFATMEDGKPVSLRESKKWIYFVNSQIDNTPPQVPILRIRNMAGELIEPSADDDSTPKLWIGTDYKFKIFVSALDNGAGLKKSFNMVFDHEDGDEFRSHLTIPINFQSVEGRYATCGVENDNSSMAEEDGNRYREVDLKYQGLLDREKYKIHFEFPDASPNANTYVHTDHYVFSVDKVIPGIYRINSNTVKTTEPTTISLNFQAYDEGTGFDHCKIYYRKKTTQAYNIGWDYTGSSGDSWYVQEVSPNIGEPSDGLYPVTATISNLVLNTAYEIKVDLYDKANNIHTYYFKKNTYPRALSTIDAGYFTYEVDEVARGIKVDIRNSYALAGINGAKFVLTKTSNSSYPQTEFTSYVTTNDSSMFLRGIDYGSTYSISAKSSIYNDIITEDCYSNKGISNELMETVLPSTVTIFNNNIYTKPKGVSEVTVSGNIYNEATNKTSVTFNCTKPANTNVRVSYGTYATNGYVNYSTPVNYSDNSITINYLRPDTRYSFKFETYTSPTSSNKVVCSDGYVFYKDVITSATTTVSNPDTVDSVRNLSVTTQSKSAILTWTKPSSYTNDSYYLVEWRKSGETTTQSCKVDINQETFAIANLKSNQYYYFYVTVYRGEKFSTKVSTVDQTKQNTSAPDITVKFDYDDTYAAGTDSIKISARNTGDGPVYLWYSDVYNYVVNGSSSCNKKTYSSWSIDQTLTGLTSDRTYYFVFKQSNENDDTSRCSEIMELKTLPSYYTDKYPAGVKVICNTETNAVNLSWTYPQKVDVSYKLKSASTWTSVGTNKTSPCSIANLTRGELYEFKLDAKNGSSTYTSGIGTTIPYVAPTYDTTTNFVKSFAQTDNGTNYITLSWTLEDDFDCNYLKIYRGSKLIADNVPKTVTSITDAGFEPGTELSYADSHLIVACKDTTYYRKKASSMEGTRMPEPTNFGVKSGGNYYNSSGNNIIELTWTAVSSNSNGYYIRWKPFYAIDWSSIQTTRNTSYTIQSGLSSATEYVVEILTRAPSANSATYVCNSEPVSISVIPAVKPVITYSSNYQRDAHSIIVKWSNPDKFNKIILQYQKRSDTEWIPALVINSTDTTKPTEYKFDHLEDRTFYDFRWLTYGDSGMETCEETTNYSQTSSL